MREKLKTVKYRLNLTFSSPQRFKFRAKIGAFMVKDRGRKTYSPPRVVHLSVYVMFLRVPPKI